MSDNTLTGHGGISRTSGKERRRFPRVDVQQRLWCEREGLTLLVQTRNISRGGVCVFAVKLPENGAEIFLSFRCGDEGLIQVPAEVVWCTSRTPTCRSGLGLRFLSREEGEFLFERFLQEEGSSDSAPRALFAWAADAARDKKPL